MICKRSFAHLHLHTEYSFLDGACCIDALMDRITELGQTSVAITDHGAMFGCVNFYKAAKKAGIKPVIGCEVYVATQDCADKGSQGGSDHHLVLLCKDKAGYKNLIKLVSASYMDGFHVKPRIDKELLKKYHEGLVCLSGCMAGELSQNLLKGDYEQARETALWFDSLFGRDDYFIEIQNHGFPEQRAILPKLISLSRETGIPLVATNNAHYLRREDAHMQSVLTCIKDGKITCDDVRPKLETDELYVKSADEMYRLFSEVPDACENTVKIIERCTFEYEFGIKKWPGYTAPDGQNNEAYFRSLCEAGLVDRYGHNPPDEARQRLEYEMSIICRTGLVNYYLFLADIVSYAKKQGISVGPGRGSNASSIAAYCLGITNIDPICYGLVFELFLTPKRVSAPFFDIDLCNERRQEVIDYVACKYGEDHIAQVVSFATMGARTAVREVGGVMGIPGQKVDAVTQMIPMEIGMSLERALDVSKPLAEECKQNTKIAEWIEVAKKIEGAPQNISTNNLHRVITPLPVSDFVPLVAIEGAVATQFSRKTIEELGLFQMDFLGLIPLTVIADTAKMIQKQLPNFSIDTIPNDDKAVYELLSSGETDGIFQLASAQMRQTLVELKPQAHENIIALIAMDQPGMTDYLPTYMHNRHNPLTVQYKTEKLVPILGVTYGCILYPEQAVQILHQLAGFSFEHADSLRRLMRICEPEVMERERAYFIFGSSDPGKECIGCVANDVPEDVAGAIYDDLLEAVRHFFFSKSHAASYAMIAYQTAWLKCYHPKQFMAALRNNMVAPLN